MLRPAAVAGRFYPAQPETLASMISGFSENVPRHPALGVVVPHAGYIYSGQVAGAVYSRIALPTRAIILCPNHTGMGPPLSIMREGAWQTPLGQVQIDSEVCDALMSADPSLEDDFLAHQLEHALEVQLPFLQYMAGKDIGLVPITLGTANWDHLERLGEAIAKTIQESAPTALIIASSDMNHYESDAITRIKDARAITPMLNRNARELYDTVRRENISMCGYGPAVAMIVAANRLGASRAELVRYATSGEVSGDLDYVVGYAGMLVT